MKNNLTGLGALLLTAVIALVLALAAGPQQKTQDSAPVPDETNDRFEYMSKELGLTPEQKPKVRAIVDAQMLQWKILQENKTLNGNQKMQQMQAINNTTQQQIDKILTPQQRQKLQAMMAAAKPQPVKPNPNRNKRPKSREE